MDFFDSWVVLLIYGIAMFEGGYLWGRIRAKAHERIEEEGSR
jgi:predicted MFS family arabinose efflux permease